MIYEGNINEFRESAERKEFLIQNAEKRIYDLEQLLIEISNYDEFVRDKLEQLDIEKPKSGGRGEKISNVVYENKVLKKELEMAK